MDTYCKKRPYKILWHKLRTEKLKKNVPQLVIEIFGHIIFINNIKETLVCVLKGKAIYI